MSSSPTDVKLLLLVDERGKDFKPIFDYIGPFADLSYTITSLPNTSNRDAFFQIQPLLDHVAFDLIISMLGLNDLVFKLPNGHATPIFSDIGTAVDKVTDDMMFFKHQLQPYQTPIVLSHIVGLDLNRFNKFQTTFTDTQYAIDEAIPHINRAIISINDDDHLHTPMIQDSIHTLSGGRRFHKYHKLYDGLHPRHNTISTWADLIQKSAIINLNNLYVF